MKVTEHMETPCMVTQLYSCSCAYLFALPRLFVILLAVKDLHICWQLAEIVKLPATCCMPHATCHTLLATHCYLLLLLLMT